MKILKKTQSLCSVCKKPIEAKYIEENGKVFFLKQCKNHREEPTIVSNSVKDYLDWIDNEVANIKPKVNITEGKENECPLHCGTCNYHLQTACCVLIDVTDRCNQNCPLCFASANENTKKELSLKEIKKKYNLLLKLGEEREFNIQISGGEPTVREDLLEIISMGREMGFSYIQLNSNGKRIAEEDGYAEKLKKAGTSVVFMQFDGTTDEIHKKLRNEPLKKMKEKAIENCRKAGLPVTLVPTIVRDVNFSNIGKMMEFLLDNVDIVKGIHFQPVSYFGRYPNTHGRVTMFDILHALEEQTKHFKYDDFCPITTGHTLCCFYSTFTKEKEKIICQLRKEAKEEGVSCCNNITPLEVIRKDRDYVVNNWNVGDKGACCCETSTSDIMNFDDFLNHHHRNTFTVTGMAFQDVSNLDAERLKRCRVVQLTDDEKLIPFCAYNSIYRGEENA